MDHEQAPLLFHPRRPCPLASSHNYILIRSSVRLLLRCFISNVTNLTAAFPLRRFTCSSFLFPTVNDFQSSSFLSHTSLLSLSKYILGCLQSAFITGRCFSFIRKTSRGLQHTHFHPSTFITGEIRLNFQRHRHSLPSAWKSMYCMPCYLLSFTSICKVFTDSHTQRTFGSPP